MSKLRPGTIFSTAMATWALGLPLALVVVIYGLDAITIFLNWLATFA